MASQGRSGSSGVRNLLAMFENKDDSTTSPPQNRGRSPVPSIGSNSASPRPLSKVRTSFVAVERNGHSGIQWGLRKESTVQTEDSNMSNRRGSFSENEATDPNVVSERKKSIQDEFQARNNSVNVSETIPEFALVTQSNTGSKQPTPKIDPKTAKPATKKPTGNPDKTTSVEERNTRLLPADTTSSAAVSGGKALRGSSDVTTGKLKPTASAKATDKATSSKSSRPAPISTSKPSASSSKSNKSPALPKTPVTPANPVKSSSRTTTAAASKAAKLDTEKATKKTNGHATATSSKTNPAAKKPALPSSTGFVKPRPKSPTKPAKLPSSLTAPTSSSLSKLADGADPRRTSGATSSAVNTAAGGPAARSPSRVAAAQKAETLRKTTSHSRPSVGPPPSTSLRKQPSRQSLPKSTAPADESFLARMMRPTTSSASKTHDKNATPPKAKVASRPGTRNGQHAKLESQGSPAAPKPMPPMPNVTKLNPLSDKLNAAKSAKKAELPAKKEAPAETVTAKDVKPTTTRTIVEQKSPEPVVEAVSVPVPAPAPESVQEPVPEPAPEEVTAEETVAPVTIAEDSIPTKPETDEPAPVAPIVEELPAPAIPTEEAEAVAAAEADNEETPKDTVAPSEDVAPVEEQPVVTDKVDIAAVEPPEEQHVVTDKVDVAAVVEETEKLHEAEDTKDVVETETETESAEPEPETTEALAEEGIVPEPTTKVPEQTSTDEVAAAPEEIAEADTEDQIATEETANTEAEKTETESEKTEAEAEVDADEDDNKDEDAAHPDNEDIPSDTPTPIPAATPVLAL